MGKKCSHGEKINDQIIRETEQYILHHEKWNDRIIQLLWIFVIILILFEGLITLLYICGLTLGAQHTNLDYALKYFILPCGLVGFTTLTATILLRTVFRHKAIEWKSRAIVIVIALVISEIAALNHGTSVVFALYVIPIILSIIYVNSFTLLLAYILSIALYLAVVYGYLGNFVPPQDYRQNYMDVLSNIGLMTAAYVLCRLLLTRIRELINTAVAQSIRRIEIARELSLDSLTQLYNHATFYERLDEYILAYKNEGAPFSLLVMDLDDFKAVNDTFGHDAGDAVILRLAGILRDSLLEDDMAFRYGGEEFTVLTGRDAVVLGEEIRDALERSDFEDINRRVTISIGAAVYGEAFGGRREFFSAADKALYRAKRSGKNRVCLAEGDE